MNYKRLFNPPTHPEPAPSSVRGDRRDGAVYLHTDQSILAVNVALATGRPLLVRGPSGCGKSSLAPHVASVMGYRFVDQVVTSRTQARDLLWEIDQLERLSDASTGHARPIADYVRPGVLWHAFDPKGAARRMPGHGTSKKAKEDGPSSLDSRRAVVLLDEMDKADPDVPNNLLVALGSLQFTVDDTGEQVSAGDHGAPLVILTTNDERELPAAFLRRCVQLELEAPGLDRLVEIGMLHFPGVPEDDLERLAVLVTAREEADGGHPVSTGEFLDVVRACHELQLQPRSQAWDRMLDIVLARPGAGAGQP